MPHRSGYPTMLRPTVPRVPASLLDMMVRAQDGGGGQASGGLGGFLERPGIIDALLAGGSALLAQADVPGTSFAGALGRAIPGAVRAGMQAKDKAEYEDAISGAPEGMRRLLRILGPERGAMFMAQQAMQGPPEPAFTNVSPGQTVLRDGEPIFTAPAADGTPSEIRSFRAVLAMSPEERAAFYDDIERRKQAETIVNVGQQPSPLDTALAQTNAWVFTEGFERAQADLTSVQTIDALNAVIDNPKFRDVSGPFWGGRFGEVRAQLADDPEAAQLVALFRTLGGMMTMQKLEEFTGPKTDFEYQQAQRLVNNDRSMTVSQIRAGLRGMRKVLEQSSSQWADRLLGMDPTILNFDPRQAQAQTELALRLNAMFGDVSDSRDPAGIRR